MAEDPQNPPPASEALAPAEEVVVGVVPDVPQAAETSAAGKEPPPPPAEAVGDDEPKVAEAEVEEKIEKASKFASFKEETNVVGELPGAQKRALDELKRLVREALSKREFTVQPSQPPPKEEEKKEDKEEAKTPAEEPSKPEAEAAAEVPPPAPVEVEEAEAEAVVIVEEVVEKVTAVEEDGAKTVEAIKETIVEVSTTASAAKTEEEAAPAAAIESKEEAEPVAELEEVFIWGVPLLGDDERSDVILLKFLRARDFKVKESFDMIKSTVRWRREFGVDALVEEDLGTDYDKAVFMHGLDRDGHPVCYNVYGEFQDKELYQKAFGDEEKRKKFLKWRIQFLERSVRKLDMSPGGVSTVVQVIDLKNSPGLLRRELRQNTGQALQILQDNYPEFVAKQVFINVPWWYLAYNRMISPFLTQRTKSKFVFASPSRTAEALFRYIAPEQVPVQYGGLSTEAEQEFTTAEQATEVTIKPAAMHTVEFPVTETCLLVWEAKVTGSDVSYGAEFVPSAEGSYTVIVQKTRKITPADEPIICGQFKVGEPGKVVLTIDNQSSKRKTLLYRSKTKACSEDQCPC